MTQTSFDSIKNVLSEFFLHKKIPRVHKIDLEENFLASLNDEIKRRRTFAIISHPDAGKTTLTEKFLLYEIGRASCRERV